MLIDSHCHIQFNVYQKDAEEVIRRSLAQGVKMVVVGSQNSTSERALEYAKKNPKEIWAAVGLHPIHLTEQEVDEEEIKFRSREEKFDFDFYHRLAREPEVVAIGECGLDFFHLPKSLTPEEVERIQAETFLAQAELADATGLPLILHCRDAHAEFLSLLKKKVREGKIKHGAVAHCFTGNWQEAKQYLDLGFYLGFTGVIAFPPKKNNPQPTLDLLEVVRNAPLEQILVETDAPYLAPPPHRGERNEPAFVQLVAQKLAEIKGLELAQVEEQTVKNTCQLFSKIKF